MVAVDADEEEDEEREDDCEEEDGGGGAVSVVFLGGGGRGGDGGGLCGGGGVVGRGPWEGEFGGLVKVVWEEGFEVHFGWVCGNGWLMGLVEVGEERGLGGYGEGFK